jgi:hypothetical protein
MDTKTDSKMNEASTITMTATLNANVDIKVAFEILPVIYPRNPDGTKFVHPKNTRNKIPYFGTENAIVCVKYKGNIRGIRQNEGQMNNVISVDLQTGHKNINLKLARTRVQLTGATSDIMGINSFEVLCSHLNMAQYHLNYIRSLPEKTRLTTIYWISDATAPSEDGQIPRLNYEFIEEQCKLIPNLDAQFATFLWQFSDEFIDYKEYNRKLRNVIEIIYNMKEHVILDSDNIGVSDCKISNSVYNYNIGLEVSLIELTKFLHKKGFNVQFHNWNSTHLKVSIPIMNEEEEEEETFSSSSGKIKAHRFSVHRGGGSIKQTSPSDSASAAEAREFLLKAISEFQELNG